ncbi:MAG: DUF4105 domain-containing protein [Phycisphaerales bacterium]
MATHMNGNEPLPRRPRRLVTALRILAWTFAWIAIVATVTWSALALWLTQATLWPLRAAMAVALALALVALPCLVRPRWKAAIVLTLCFLAVFAWYRSRPASNDRNWTIPVSVTPTFEIDGDRLTVHGVRNFEWRRDGAAGQDFDAAWEDRTYDLSRLRTLDLFMSFWGLSLVSHTFISFGFERDDGTQDYLCCSIEFRPEVGERFDPVRSMFRNFELVYVVGDERDIVRVRTSVRGEQVLLYRLDTKRDSVRALLEVYAREANELAATPQWYNAIVSSCGVNLITKTWAAGAPGRVSHRMLLNGLWDRFMYEWGLFETDLPFDEIRRRSDISARGKAAGDAPDFSQRIREDLVSVPMARPAS